MIFIVPCLSYCIDLLWVNQTNATVRIPVGVQRERSIDRKEYRLSIEREFMRLMRVPGAWCMYVYGFNESIIIAVNCIIVDFLYVF